MDKLIINLNKIRNEIPKEIYGQFAEHLGNGIYGGVYVGEDNELENINGIRLDVVEALKDLEVPVIRWPGGCFADQYHWRDGIGAKSERKTIINKNWGDVVENNHFGTHEFFELCELVGADPYLNINVGSGTVREMQDWIEYITSDNPKSDLVKLRKKNGREKSWNLKWVGVGNENWGCGGNMTPDFYSDLYRQFDTYLGSFNDTKINSIACGANIDDYDWTETVVSRTKDLADALTLHYYTFDGTWENKGDSLDFNEMGWDRFMHNGHYMKELLDSHLSIMDRYDPDGKISLIVDEWGAWHKPLEGTNPHFLEQQNTIRDALNAAATLNLFNKYSDRVKMSNIAQMINVLQAMIITNDEDIVLTPTYYVYLLYKKHMNAKLLETWSSFDEVKKIHEIDNEKKVFSYPAISHSASMKDGDILLTVCNLTPDQDYKFSLEVLADKDKANWEIENIEILSAKDGKLNAHNTFENKNCVIPRKFEEFTHEDSNYVVEIPKGSLLAIEITID